MLMIIILRGENCEQGLGWGGGMVGKGEGVGLLFNLGFDRGWLGMTMGI